MTKSVTVLQRMRPMTNSQKPMSSSSNTQVAKAVTPEQPRKLEGSTDITTLQVDVPVQYADILDNLKKQLRDMLGMHEVTSGEPNGPVISLSLKGTVQVLTEANERLGRAINLNIGEEQARAERIRTTSKAGPAHRPEQLEAPTATAYIPAQLPLTPPQSPGTGGTPINPVDATKCAAAPICSSPCVTIETQSIKRQLPSKHEARATKHSTKPTAPGINVDISLRNRVHKLVS